MEYADGGDLSAALRRRKDESPTLGFTTDDSLAILAQVLQALQHMHAKRVLHRDIKAQNIFLTASGLVKLGDFGVSKVLEQTAGAAQTVIGTPSYFAPEVCESKPYGSKADIWSLGVVLYELLSLKQPFQAHNIAALVIRIITQEPPPLPETCGQHVQELVSCTLRKLPEERPAASELLNRQEVRRRVGARFQPFGAVSPSMSSRKSSKTAKGFKTEVLAQEASRKVAAWACHPLTTEQELDGSSRFETGAAGHGRDALDDLLQGTNYGSSAAAGTRTLGVSRREHRALPTEPIAQSGMLEELQRNREQARLNRARVEGPHAGSAISSNGFAGFGGFDHSPSHHLLVPGSFPANGSRPGSNAGSRPGSNASSRPGSGHSSRGGCSRPSTPGDGGGLGSIARLSKGVTSDESRFPSRPSSSTGFGAAPSSSSRPCTGYGSGAALHPAPDRTHLKPPSSPERWTSSRPSPLAAIGRQEADSGPKKDLQGDMDFGNRFAWATKFLDAPLDQPLWSGTEVSIADKRKDGLQKLYHDLSQLSDDSFGSKATTKLPAQANNTVRHSSRESESFSFKGDPYANDGKDFSESWGSPGSEGCDFTETWGAAQAVTGGASPPPEVTISNQDMLAAALQQ
ncbi:unnamed protein product [Polarella glacialis]|uniref:non-specific serine/threonine protein kinase n=1 Tax=Polarella glacialis TaxID=89957 RepID=A0A813KKX3_POLGL|nr:unnamed protein product [Polarella glacialis]